MNDLKCVIFALHFTHLPDKWLLLRRQNKGQDILSLKSSGFGFEVSISQIDNLTGTRVSLPLDLPGTWIPTQIFLCPCGINIYMNFINNE